MFPTIRVTRESAEAQEWMGTKRKFWFPREDGRWLFKAEERGTGEDWAEKIVCELAQRLGLPRVRYELAEEYDGAMYLQPGVICPHCAPAPSDLVLGNQLLLDSDLYYPGSGGKRYKVKEYTVAAVVECLRGLRMPPAAWTGSLPSGITTPLDVFTGYVLLDAWVANQDRHHENWGAIRVRGEEGTFLAPTFDHGASLARNLSDEERKDRLESRDEGRRIPNFASRARSAFYGSPQDERPLGTVEAFQAFHEAAPEAGKIWLDRLEGVTSGETEAIVWEVPPARMTTITRRFTVELLAENRRRLIELRRT